MSVLILKLILEFVFMLALALWSSCCGISVFENVLAGNLFRDYAATSKQAGVRYGRAASVGDGWNGENQVLFQLFENAVHSEIGL